jgi:hypothetical protein
MKANRGYRAVLNALVAGIRVCTVVGGEVFLGSSLRWASRPTGSPAALASGSETGPSGVWTLGQLVVAAAIGLAWVAFVLLAVTTAVTVLLVPAQRMFAATPRVAWLGGPLWWRRAVLAACGLSLVSPVAATAAPASDGSHPHCPAVACSVGSVSSFPLSGLQLPDLPDTAPKADGSESVRIVRPGDSLWRIASDDLPASASTSTICRRVETWYAANRAVIGPDPDLILPGTELTQPGGTA